jgi:hypothetical protein
MFRFFSFCLLFVACGSEAPSAVEVTVDLERADPSCDSALLESLDSLEIVLDAEKVADRLCLSTRGPSSVEALSRELHDAGIGFRGLGPGRGTITLAGFDDPGCDRADLMICGAAEFELPAERIVIPLRCDDLAACGSP